jgi:hypothetical protein
VAELGVDEGGVGVLLLWVELPMYYREVVGPKNESRTAHQLETSLLDTVCTYYSGTVALNSVRIPPAPRQVRQIDYRARPWQNLDPYSVLRRRTTAIPYTPETLPELPSRWMSHRIYGELQQDMAIVEIALEARPL